MPVPSYRMRHYAKIASFRNTVLKPDEVDEKINLKVLA
jgi:hypothetical protein